MSRDAAAQAPCLIGTARRTWREPGSAPEPLDMWVELARGAAADAGAGRVRGPGVDGGTDLLGLVDDLGVVHCQSWAYDDPAARLATELDLGPGRRTVSILAGTSPQRLCNSAAERMLRGETRAALVVGGEALATRRRFDLAGEVPPWRHPHPSPPVLPVDLDEWYLPTEVAHGVLPAWLTFALLDQARWAERGATDAERRATAAVYEHLNAVAAANPDAWFTERLDADAITTPTAANRMVADPYTKRMTAFLDVDMAAGLLLVTRELADELGVDPSRRVYLRGWGFARDATHLGARADLHRSPAMVAAAADTLAGTGVGLEDVDRFELYSCFGSAVRFAQDALGLRGDDPRPLTVTGGLPYHGGPSSNYLSHALSHLADVTRAEGGTTFVTGVGMHMTKHVAALWSAEPGPVVPPDTDATMARVGATHPDVEVAGEATGPAAVLAATGVHGRDGAPTHAVALCELPDGRRAYATTSDPDAVDAVVAGGWVGAKADLRPTGSGTNDLHL